MRVEAKHTHVEGIKPIRMDIKQLLAIARDNARPNDEIEFKSNDKIFEGLDEIEAHMANFGSDLDVKIGQISIKLRQYGNTISGPHQDEAKITHLAKVLSEFTPWFHFLGTFFGFILLTLIGGIFSLIGAAVMLKFGLISSNDEANAIILITWIPFIAFAIFMGKIADKNHIFYRTRETSFARHKDKVIGATIGIVAAIITHLILNLLGI